MRGKQGRVRRLGVFWGAILLLAECSSSGPSKLVDGAVLSGSDTSGTADATALPSEPMGCGSFYTMNGTFCPGRWWAGGAYRCLEGCRPPGVSFDVSGMFPCMAAYAGDGGSSSRDVVCIPAGGCGLYCPEGTASHD